MYDMYVHRIVIVIVIIVIVIIVVFLFLFCVLNARKLCTKLAFVSLANFVEALERRHDKKLKGNEDRTTTLTSRFVLMNNDWQMWDSVLKQGLQL